MENTVEIAKSIISDTLTLPEEVGAYIGWGENPVLVYIPIEEMQSVYEQIIAENMDWAEKANI